MTRTRVAVIGAAGFVGKAITQALDGNHEVIRVVRGDDLQEKIRDAEIVIHSANPGKRYWAQQNPEKDFFETVEKTASIVEACQGKKLVLISTISARTQIGHIYGDHRRAAELIVQAGAENSLIIRLGAMFGCGKATGALADLLVDRDVFVASSTRYAYLDVAYVGEKIVSCLSETGLLEIGARNSISLKELAQEIGSKSSFSGPDDSQIPVIIESAAPDAYDILSFARQSKRTSS